MHVTVLEQAIMVSIVNCQTVMVTVKMGNVKSQSLVHQFVIVGSVLKATTVR